MHDRQALSQLSCLLATPWMGAQGCLLSPSISLLRAILSSAFRVSEAEQRDVSPSDLGRGDRV